MWKLDMFLVIFVVCFLFSNIYGVEGKGGLFGRSCYTCYMYEDEVRLHNDLLNSNYSTRVRPTKNMSQPIVVQAEFQLYSIIEFREKDRLFSVSGGFLFSWDSDNLIWDPANYNGIISTVLPKKEVWTPLLTPTNPFSDFQPLGTGDGSKEIPIRVVYFGTTFWHHNDVFSSSCRADVTVYPFDVQVCELRFLSVYLTTDEFLLQCPNEYRYTETILEHFVENGAWELVETKLFNPKGNTYYQTALTVRFTIKRRPMYHLVNVVFPLLVISLLNVLVFLMPAESGERVSFAVTILLAMSVFLTIVSDKLPETSEPSVAYLSYFMLIDLVVSLFVVVLTVIGLRFHFKKEDENMSAFYKWFARLYFQTCCCTKARINKVNQNTIRKCEQNVSNGNRHDHATGQHLYNCHGLPYITEKHNGNDTGDIKHNPVTPEVAWSYNAGYIKHRSVTPEVTWSHFASMFDITLFLGFTVILVIKNVFMFLILTQGNQP